MEITGESFCKNIGLFQSSNTSSIPSKSMKDVRHTIISIAVLQIALYDLYSSIGLKPDIVIGHSLGEIAMHYAAGILDKRETLKLLGINCFCPIIFTQKLFLLVIIFIIILFLSCYYYYYYYNLGNNFWVKIIG